MLGKDKDVGYSSLRMDRGPAVAVPSTSSTRVINALLAPFFEWGIAIYDLELEALKEGEKSKEALKQGPQGPRPQGADASSPRTTPPRPPSPC